MLYWANIWNSLAQEDTPIWLSNEQAAHEQLMFGSKFNSILACSINKQAKQEPDFELKN